MYLSLGSKITEFFNNVKDFFLEHSRNPFLWVSIILLFLLVFEFVYNTLKDKQ